MRLLERDAPLAALHDLRSQVAAEGGRLVFVEGEAGIGKTSLLSAFRSSVPDGVRVLLGSCDPLSTPRPLGPLVDVAAELDPAFAALVSAQAPRAAVLEGLLDALRRRDRSVVLLLDDLHWADEATLDALRFVGRRVDSTNALVIGTYRDDEVGRQHPLRVVVGDLATSPAVRRLPLAPLSQQAVGVLASGSGLDPETLHAQTGGNPFYVTEVIAGAPTRIPATVRDAVLARAARLSEAGRRTLEAAAVIGPTIDPVLLSNVVDGPLAAEECLARGMLQSDGHGYAFRHEVARDAILDATDPGHRIRLHARILAALEAGSDDADLARLAHHADGAGDRAAVLRYAPQAAAEAAASGAHREAAAQYRRALDVAGALEPGERATLLEASAAEHALIAKVDVTNAQLAEAIAIWHDLGAVGREGTALANRARSLIVEGRNPEAEADGRRALEVTAALEHGPERVEALAVQAYLRMLERDNAQAIELGREAIELAQLESAATYALVLALNTVGAARILLDEIDAGIADLERSIALANDFGIERMVAGGYSNLASALGEMYRFDDALRYVHDGLRYASERDLDATRFYIAAWHSLILVHRGRWPEGGDVAASVVRSAGVSAISTTMANLALGRLRARRGDPDAWPALDEALSLSTPTRTLQRLGPVHAARAEAAWLDGDPRRSAAEALAVLELAIAKSHPWHIGELSWWLTKAGRSAPRALPRIAEPWALQLDGRWREAARAWDALGCPYEAARALLDADDVAAVEQAYRTFDELGARPAAAVASQRLRELGARTIPRGRRPSTRANAAGLTVRELEVLRLVARGLPNGDIARRLFLSTRTVDHHVSALLGKLGVERRGDAAAAAGRLGIDVQNGQVTRPD